MHVLLTLVCVTLLGLPLAGFLAAGQLDAGRPVQAVGAQGVPVIPQLVGNPFANKPVFSRNVWDMQAFGNRIYFGHGDYGDNAGPIPLHYLDTSTQQLLTDYVVGTINPECQLPDGRNQCVDDEEINNIRVIDNKLYIPGIDAREGTINEWDLGNFYTRNAADTAWVKHRTVPNGVHVFDLSKLADPQAPSNPPRLVAAIGDDVNTSPVISNDDGQTVAGWSGTTVDGGTVPSMRLYRLFSLAGKSYASSLIVGNHVLARYLGGLNFSQVPYAEANRMFPDRLDVSGLLTTPLRVFREIYVANQMLYTGINGDQQLPIGLYRALDVTQAQAVALPVAGVRAMDLLVGADGKAYVLAQTGSGASYTNFVFASADLVGWSEVLRFGSVTFARSFEYLADYFYFGLGTTRAAASPAAGDILRVYDPRLPPPTTPTATPAATPTPHPNVGVAVRSTQGGRLWVTLTARPTGCSPTNRLQELRFTADPRVYRNGAIEIDGAVRTPPFTVSLPEQPTSKTFAVVQATAGSDTTVPVTARDSCGEWSTFVGGGASAFQPPLGSSGQPPPTGGRATASPTPHPGSPAAPP